MRWHTPATRLAEHLGVGNEITAALTLCYALACDREWQPVLDAAGDALQLIRERGAQRLFEPSFLAHIGAAQLALGNLEAGRAAAAEGVVFMRPLELCVQPAPLRGARPRPACARRPGG